MGFWKDVGSAVGGFFKGAAGSTLIGSGLSAIGGLIGSNQTNKSNLGVMREQMAWNTKEREASQLYNTRERVSSQEWQDQQRRLQNNWARDMYEAYQTPQALVEQYKAAGINPRLAMGSNSVGNVSASSGASGGAPSGTHVSPMGVSAPYMSSQGYVSAFGDIANIMKTLGEAKKLGIETDNLEEEIKARIDGMKLDNEGKKLLNEINKVNLPAKMRLELLSLAQSIENATLTSEQIKETIHNLKLSGKYQQKELDSYEARLQSLLDLQNSTKNNLDSGSRLNDSNVSLNARRELNIDADTALKWSERDVNRAHIGVERATEALLKSQKLTEGQRQLLMRSQRFLFDSQYSLNSLAHEIRSASSTEEKEAAKAKFAKEAAEYKLAMTRFETQLEGLTEYGVASDLVNGVLSALDLVKGALNPFKSDPD